MKIRPLSKPRINNDVNYRNISLAFFIGILAILFTYAGYKIGKLETEIEILEEKIRKESTDSTSIYKVESAQQESR